MIRLILIFVLISLTSCSFDDKTGIWKDASNIPYEKSASNSIEKNNVKSRYEDVFTESKIFNEEKELERNFNFKIEKELENTNWSQEFASNTNNISNIEYDDNKNLLSRSSKLSKNLKGSNDSIKNIVLYNDKLISYDHKGRVFAYSLIEEKKVFEYNFYKKTFKKYSKRIFLIVNKDIIYAADNLGYIYALDINSGSLIWAKNYGIPFRSNIKFHDNQIFLASQDNVLYSVNPSNGEKNWQLSTSLTFLKSEFKNNIALDELNNNIIFLNTSGELYSINYVTQRINWVLNFKNLSQQNEANLFLSQPVVIKDETVIVSTDKSLLSYNVISGARNWNKIVAPILKPVITQNNIFTFTKNNLLICLEKESGNILWSKNIYFSIKKKQKRQKLNKIGKILNLTIANGKINLFSENGYLFSFNFRDGSLNYFNKVSKQGLGAEPIFSNKNMFLVDKKNRLLKFN